jgi:peptidoglycan/xylan/chitin deacetylase (PgdA/CDA1 family)
MEQRFSKEFDVPAGGYPPVEIREHGLPNASEVALTFDDGPHPEQTPRLLDLLGERGVRATFYVIGENARNHPEIVRRMFDEGHEIGNHTWSHRFLTTQSARSVKEELLSTDQVIEEITGTRPATLRPPYGAFTRSLAAWAHYDLCYQTVLWSVDSKDYEGLHRSEIADRVVEGAVAGSIVLMHDPLPETVAAISESLDRLIGRGIQFTTARDLLAS